MLTETAYPTPALSTKKRKRMDQTSDHPLPTNHELSGWTYHLEILQEPLRARACGFGNKDRRPLTPPPIIRLWIRDALGNQVDPNTVDSNTLVLQIDLCSADGHEGRNVVRHPAGPGNAPAVVSMGENARSGHVDPSTLPPITTAVSDQPYEDTSTDHSSWSKQYPLESSDRTTPGWTYQDNFVSSSLVAGTRPLITRRVRTPTRPSTAPSSRPPAWSLDVSRRPLHEEVLPPISALAEDLRHSSGHSWFPDPHNDMRRPTSSSSLRSRPHTSHSTDLSTAPTDYSIGRPTTTSSTTSWHLPLNSEYKGFALGSQAAEDPETDAGGGPDDSKVPTSSAETQTTSPRHFLPGYFTDRFSLYDSPRLPNSYQNSHYPSNVALIKDWDSFHSPDLNTKKEIPCIAPASAASTLVLVGKRHTPCNRLKDEHGQLGLFFFATDLGVRTEGRFCLRMKIMDLSLFLRAPSPGDSVPILAETISQPIEVYSAKRFPGVIPTTKLTRLFAAQGIKLAVRESHKQKYRNKESVDMDVQDGIDEDEDGQ
ncbi:hypothetical protein I307_00822 [Cryptococcus deuterogattii 99/473]|uniref:Unplaced genomic scaffold supercont1.3, whole genome shotgun sequence n=1 Tax=Cryptococcus deuterogattii Ram5 TaxID=1296110 RepID=A0A0D0V6W1_9TREE|nr:hypothetical protein I309_00272 [Cryptococcus deuterogattii LA55]KIR42344.1 hypothetical protein I313_01568 [Cryptococcus deuterogattii Ram5]KIR94988.1 hypothetical protein I304_01314 [Cryptococcus deuterogattii CBS 10090]KIY59748.1 hypothetical protein I307_00822 [Cryptococcus deuterogattii 99/473]